ncbi:hypothetical protein OG401_41225 [Kitasatospora purpeofusca]|uniref:hypothetical protein n=1 Tax=Kitasatospora purpeofusca TaxID=67352 RepID=UPI0022593614|nr:hypothetical protein [Kitasatospora purpeofusca]MCX4690643.1 hypothetical protein [Kitasatospora purpeofusca]
MTTIQPYPADTLWTYRNKNSGYAFTTGMHLSWQLADADISHEYKPDEITAHQLYRRWAEKYGNRLAEEHPQHYRPGDVEISWTVTGDQVDEFAPFQIHVPGEDTDHEDFLTHFTMPTDVRTGEQVNWLRLPVDDRRWNSEESDLGGFVQESLGWKPSPLQHVVNLRQLEAAAGPGRS